jgi:hypothetical protein
MPSLNTRGFLAVDGYCRIVYRSMDIGTAELFPLGIFGISLFILRLSGVKSSLKVYVFPLKMKDFPFRFFVLGFKNGNLEHISTNKRGSLG